MARQVSWEPRLHEIRRSVLKSVRSHYDRRDLEQLFKLQPRAAGKLLESLSGIRIGRSQLVSREALSKFLDGAMAAEDVAGYCAAQRAGRETQSRRKPRSLVRRDVELVPAASLSRWIKPGLITIPYASLAEAFDVLWRFASAGSYDLDNLYDLYEVERPVETEAGAAGEVREMFAELEQMERARGRSSENMDTKERPSRSPVLKRLAAVADDSPILRHPSRGKAQKRSKA